MSFGPLERPDGLWWTVPYAGEPAIKLFLPMAADADEPVVLIWQGTATAAVVLLFVGAIDPHLRIGNVESLAEEPPRSLSPPELELLLETAAGPDGHFFLRVHGRSEAGNEELSIWGDGPRSRAEGLTPELGLAMRSSLLQTEPMTSAIIPLLRASFRWQDASPGDIARVVGDLVTEQARIHRRWLNQGYARA